MVSVRSAALTSLLALTACTAPPPLHDAPAMHFYDRATVLSLGAILLDVRVVGEATPGDADDGTTHWDFFSWDLSVLHQLGPSYLQPFPNHGRFLQVTHVTNVATHQSETFAWGSGQLWRPSIHPDGRYLLVSVQGVDARSPGAVLHTGLYALTDAGALAEPALGYPTGTPISTVLDPTGLDPLLVDAGTAQP